MSKYDMPYTIVEEIAYDPAARDLSVEVAKAKATNADVYRCAGEGRTALY
jgi:branched-chain amino acid transport system substrate-binding protein